MLNKLLTRQKVTLPSGAAVDSYGRISRYPADTWAGTYVDTFTAISVPGVWRAVTLISDAIGGLPLQAYRNGEPIDTPPILSRPNPPETRMETISAAVATCIIHGNYVAILGPLGPNGYPETIYPVNPERVTFRTHEGRRQYIIDTIVFDQSEVMHVKGFSLPGEHVGLGILSAQRQGLGASIAMHEYAARYFSGGTTPSVALITENPDLTQEDADLMKQKWLMAYGGRSREPVVLGNTKVQVVQDNATESQLTEQKQFDLTEVANMLGIPGYYLGAPNTSRTYSNVEQEQLQLLRFTLLPWMIRFEQAFSDLLPRGQVAKFNVDAFLRADTLTRYQAHQIALQTGFLSLDEVRRLEDLMPMEGEQLDAGPLEVDPNEEDLVND